MSETWKNGSVPQKASYGNIAEKQKEQAQKVTSKYFESSFQQTLAFVNSLPAGTHVFIYPTVIEHVVDRSGGTLEVLAKDRSGYSITIRKN